MDYSISTKEKQGTHSILFPEFLFLLTSGRKSIALGATISDMRHRCRLCSETGWTESVIIISFVISKPLLQKLSFSDRWSRGTKIIPIVSFVISKPLLQKLSFSDRCVKGNKDSGNEGAARVNYPKALVFRPLVKGNKDSGNEIDSDWYQQYIYLIRRFVV